MHSGHMTDDGATRFYWCLRHQRVETDENACAERYLLGPFDTEAAARDALRLVRQRNEEWEAEDARWNGDA